MSAEDAEKLLDILKKRFEDNMHRHKDIEWMKVEQRLELGTSELWTLAQMEETGGQPDVAGFDDAKGKYIFFDCSSESPSERRSLCYDQKALDSRKSNKPRGNAQNMAAEMGAEILTYQQYLQLQELESFNRKTSSWIQIPKKIRALGGALFCDRRFDHVFYYHNGADSYYSSRGFRVALYV